MTTAPLASTVVPIQENYDIAIARNILRVKVRQQGWPANMTARAATALTALGEIILALNRQQPIVIKIEIAQEAIENKRGVRLVSQLLIPDKNAIKWQERKLNLKSLAHDSEILERGENVQIKLNIWD